MEFGALTVSAPALARSPRGDGHPVLVLPGLLASDASTLILRRFLTRLGYATAGWGLGLNVGPTNEVVRRLPLRLGELFRPLRTACVHHRMEPRRGVCPCSHRPLAG